jgi:nitronate monooxygenase
VVSFHFGLPKPEYLEAIRATGAAILSTATTVREAVSLAQQGVDAVIAQGWEAGGHRGSFVVNADDVGVGTLALVPQVVDAIDRPVIAAGGIADGRGIAAAFMLGASGVQMGTAFLPCPESGVGQRCRRALAEATDEDTRLSKAFSGRPARAMNNRYVAAMAGAGRLPDFPTMYGYSLPLVEASESAGDDEFQFLLYGQAAALGRALPAAELVRLLVDEAQGLLG